MIVPMKKVTLLALESETDSTLAALRALGVMQIELQKGAPSACSAELAEECETDRRTLGSLEKLFRDRKDKPDQAKAKHSGAEALELAGSLLEERSAVSSELDAINSRSKALAVWGDFDRKQLDTLRAKGIYIALCSGSQKELEAIKLLPDAEVRIVEDEGIRAHFIVTMLKEPEAGTLPEIHLTEQDDPAELTRRASEATQKLDLIDADLAKLFDSLPAARHRLEVVASHLTFSQVRDSLAEHGAIISLNGFVPEPDVEKLENAARENGWGLWITDPAEGEMVPTLIKRSRLARIIEPLFSFLGIAPGYDEMDVSSGVLIFFTIFYSMIIGDAGYGLIFLIAALFAGWNFRDKAEAHLPVVLLTLLSVATIAWGVMTDNVFGVKFPHWMDWAKIPALTAEDSNIKNANTMCFCFILAVAQLSMGRLWRAIHDGTLKSYAANIGWTLVIWGNFVLTIKLLVYPGAFPNYMWYLFGAGLVLVVFSDVNWKNPADIFQFPFNVIGSFTDVLSYIRLFAVGLAGFYIADSFNGMGKSLFALSPWLIVAAALVILLGHALNLALCVMSVMVHGVRLNTLEFSNHVGLRWGGMQFKPFKNSVKLEEN